MDQPLCCVDGRQRLQRQNGAPTDQFPVDLVFESVKRKRGRCGDDDPRGWEFEEMEEGI